MDCTALACRAPLGERRGAPAIDYHGRVVKASASRVSEWLPVLSHWIGLAANCAQWILLILGSSAPLVIVVVVAQLFNGAETQETAPAPIYTVQLTTAPMADASPPEPMIESADESREQALQAEVDRLNAALAESQSETDAVRLAAEMEVAALRSEFEDRDERLADAAMAADDDAMELEAVRAERDAAMADVREQQEATSAWYERARIAEAELRRRDDLREVVGTVNGVYRVMQTPPPGAEQIREEIRLEVVGNPLSNFEWSIEECDAFQIGGHRSAFFRFRVDRSSTCAIHLRYGGGEQGPYYVNVQVR